MVPQAYYLCCYFLICNFLSCSYFYYILFADYINDKQLLLYLEIPYLNHGKIRLTGLKISRKNFRFIKLVSFILKFLTFTNFILYFPSGKSFPKYSFHLNLMIFVPCDFNTAVFGNLTSLIMLLFFPFSPF